MRISDLMTKLNNKMLADWDMLLETYEVTFDWDWVKFNNKKD